MTSVLITGGTGFIGRNLVERLASRYAILAPSSTELSLLDAVAVRDYLQANHVDVIVHAATTRSSRRQPPTADLLERNLRMFFNLARNEALFGKMIQLGSGAEYGRDELPPRVRETYFDARVPSDPYGFSKYICGKYVERAKRLVELRLFGVFGKYEDWTVRFISNACCRVIKGLPIVIRQNVVFDYLYVADLADIIAKFIDQDSPHRAYNVCTGKGVSLLEIASVVAEVSGLGPEVIVRRSGLGPEYTADNSRMLSVLGEFRFCALQKCVEALYRWYGEREGAIAVESLRFDEESQMTS